MILNQLKLQNFKKYRSFEIKFETGLTGIIGKNGSGKSTIFESIFFALYGEVTNKSMKKTLRNTSAKHTDAVSVELLFVLDGVDYKVIREFRGKDLIQKANLYKVDELISTGVIEVTKSITRLTKMSKIEFKHTLFASQKELTSLSTLDNEDRKKMIRRLLGLEKIDKIETYLKEYISALKSDIKSSNALLLTDEEVKQRQSHIQNHENDIDTLVKERKLFEKQLSSTNKNILKTKAQNDQFQKTKELKDKTKNSLAILQNTTSSNKKQLEKIKEDLSNLDAIEKELDSKNSIKKEYKSVSKELKNQEDLKEKHLTKIGLEEKQIPLRKQYKELKEQIGLVEKTLSSLEEITQEEEIKKKALQTLEKEEDKLTKTKNDLSQKIATQKDMIKDIENKIKKIESLGKNSPCPTCTRVLLDEYDKVLQTLYETIQTDHTKNINIYTKEKKDVDAKLKIVLNEKNGLTTSIITIGKEIAIIKQKKKDLLNTKRRYEEVKKEGSDNRGKIEELKQFKYEKNIHEKLQKEHIGLQKEHDHILSLEAKLQRQSKLKEEKTILESRLIDDKKELSNKIEELNKIDYNENKHKASISEYDKLQTQKETLIENTNEIKLNITRIDGDIKSLQTSIKDDKKKKDKVSKKQNDLDDYMKIKSSLYEFKTMINSKIAPRISTIASDMYAQITKGKYQHIEVDNDFSFYIYDEGVKYPIERFSGGEIDLANLVLRIAISKTLSELNGSSNVEFLAFDEIFGSQDENRRLQIMEAFHTIKEQYRQIFLISHESEIKDMLERVIEV